MFKLSTRLLSIILLFTIFAFAQSANASSNTPLEQMSAGSIVNFGGKQWILLNPNAGYIITKDSQTTRNFDPDSYDPATYKVLDPNKLTNIAYWLNNDFFSSLTNKDWIAEQSWQINDFSFNQSGLSTITKIGLISWQEWNGYKNIIGNPPSQFWTRTPLHGNNTMIMVNTNGSFNYTSERNYTASVRPSLYLKSGLFITNEGYVTEDPGDITMDDFSSEVQTKLNSMEEAKNAANAAKTSADSSKNMLNGSSNGGKSLAATYDKANSANSNTAYIRNTLDTELPDLQNKINNMETTITNINNSIQNSDDTPPTVDVQTVSGARATSASSIAAIITVTDNKSGPFTYSINGGAYNNLPSDGRVNLPVTSSGNNSITVYVKDAAGNVGSKNIVIRRL